MKLKASVRLKEKFSKIPSLRKIHKRLPPEIAKQNSTNGMIAACGKKVIDNSTGVIYKTIVEAANSIGMKKDTLRHKLNGTNPNNTSLIYASRAI